MSGPESANPILLSVLGSVAAFQVSEAGEYLIESFRHFRLESSEIMVIVKIVGPENVLFNQLFYCGEMALSSRLPA